MPVGNRPVNDWPHLVGKKWDDLVAREIQDFFSRLAASLGGLPAGFTDTPGLSLKEGSSGAAGHAEKGWAAADHTHPILLTNKGDSLTHDGDDVVREAVGPNGSVLMADSNQDTGRRWEPTPLGGGVQGSSENHNDFLTRMAIESYAVRDIICKHYR